jgi:hypothetical protein
LKGANPKHQSHYIAAPQFPILAMIGNWNGIKIPLFLQHNCKIIQSEILPQIINFRTARAWGIELLAIR